MINLKTNCEDCIHNKVCKNKNNPKVLKEKLEKQDFGHGPNDDYTWEYMMQVYNIDIDFSCPNFMKKGNWYPGGGFDEFN